MPRFEVEIPKMIWFTLYVEADDQESAIDAAMDEAPGLCTNCSGWGQDWTIDEDDWGSQENLVKAREVE